MSKLPDVRGRITHIFSHAKQENLYAVYETTDRHYWTELAKCSQQEFQKSGTEGTCIEAKEFIIALPESFQNFMSRTSYYSCSQTALKKSTVWNDPHERSCGVCNAGLKGAAKGTKIFDTEQIQPHMPVQKLVCQPPEKETQIKLKIPPKPVMPAEVAVYPKLFKIYKELKRQKVIIFEAEKKRNALEFERDDLKGLVRFTKKGELQSRIDRRNEEIDILKISLSGIAKRYGY